MAITLEQLIQTQKQIQALFLRPVRLAKPHEVPECLRKWYTLFAQTPVPDQPDGYRWGLNYLEGVAVSWPEHPGLDIYLTTDPPRGFTPFLTRLFSEVPLRFIVTGRFQFLQGAGFGIGSEISLEDPGMGMGVIGLCLKDAAGHSYVLTCAHVLDEVPAAQPVDSGNTRIGVLSFRIPISEAPLVNPRAPDPQAPNQVDCALAELNSAGRTNALPAALGNVDGFFTVSQGANVMITNANKNVPVTVTSTLVDLSIPYHLSRVYFDGLIATTGEKDIEPGDSGSLVVSADNLASGLVMAISANARTIDHPPQNLGRIVIVCDMQKILDNLAPLVGSPLGLV